MELPPNDLDQRLRAVRTRAIEVFDDAVAAESWLNSPSLPLGNKCPIDLAGTADGLRIALNALTAIEHGLPP